MLLAIKIAILAVLLSKTDFVNGYYVALIPKVIREHSSSLMVIANIGFEHDEQFKISQNGKARDVDVPINVTMTVKSKLLNGRNTVQIIDKRSGDATDLTVTMDKSSLSIYIQTDKPIYKPGDTIRFRVLVLDLELKPSVMLKSINVKLADSQSNLIREWSYGELFQGVFQSELELANFVPLGNWTLTATVMNGKIKSKVIKVDEYVLPKHEIRISSSKIAIVTDDTLTLIVDAVYTFGKPIRGELTVIAENSEQEIQTSINGRTIVHFDMDSLVEGQHFGETLFLTVNATIEELGTDQQFKQSVQIPIYRDSYRMTFRKSSEYLTPGVYFKCWITVTDPAGHSFKNPGNMIVKADHGKKTVITKKPNQNGVVYLLFDDIKDYSRALKLDVTFAGKTSFFSVDPIHEDDSFIQATIVTEDPEQDQPIKVLVTSSFDLDPFLYFVIARGEILSRARIHARARQKSSFSLPATLGMVPSASLVVMAVHEGRLMQDVVHFRVNKLKNFVNVSLSEYETEPRRQLQVLVDTLPGSVVGLLAVDKSVLLLGSGNDITRKSLQEDGIIQESKDIEDLGFTVLTNAQPSLSSIGEIDTRICDSDQDDRIRKHFPETWLWTEMMPASSSGSLSLTATVPDTITGWSISAFAVNSQHGLGLIEQPVTLTVVKPFFITVNVAYSILKTEIALIEVFVYNYGIDQEEAEVTLQVGSEEFQLLNDEQDVVGGVQLSGKVSTPPKGIERVSFFAKPKRSGDLTITVTAKTTSNKFDGVQQTIKVTSGGIKFYQNEARFIDVEDSSQNFTNLALIIPRTATNGSENIVFSLEGLLMGAALTNLNGLIRLPEGCGEQKLVKLVPTVIALEYMSVTGTLGNSMKSKALEYLRKGYQSQLEFKRKDGSFHVFNSDNSGSLMVTAIVAKTLRIAGKHITVDDGIVRSAYDWIQRQQRPDGSFSEGGRIISRRMQGSLGDDVPLTAYTLIAILEHKNLAQKYKTVVDKGATFLSRKLDSLTKPYHLAMVAYVLQLSKHNRKQTALEKLIEISKSADNMRWWDDGKASIETTAYALLTFLNNGMYIDAGPLMKWLVSKRYDLGGFDNTQNTLLGLQALAEYSKLLSPSRNNYEVTVSYGDNRHSLKIQGMTAPISQSLTLPSNTRKVSVAIAGTGTGVFQIAYQYNQIATDAEPRFELNKTIRRSSSDSVLDLHICAKYKPKKRYEVTNMVLMEVLFPSGYVVSDKTIGKLRNNKEVMKIEKEQDDTRLVLYFDSLSDVNATCVEVSSLRKAVVLGQIAGMIKVYDYYDPDREAYEYFDAKARPH